MEATGAVDLEGKGVAKMIDRAPGPGPGVTPEYGELVERWEAKAARTPPRTGKGSGAVDRTISDLPLRTLYGPDSSSRPPGK